MSIPLEDITLTYASTGFAGNGSITLVYTAGTPPTWVSGCLDAGTYDVTGGGSPTHNYLKFQLSCSTPGQTQIHYDRFTNSGCTGALPGTGFMTIDSFSGTPFHLHHNVIIGEASLWFGGFTTLDYDSPTNAPGACKYIFSVSGCNFISAPGVSISAWTSAAKTTLLGTLVGDGTIVSTERTTNGHYEITGSRFTSLSGNGLTSSATSTNSFNLTPTASYHCDGGICGWPIAGTLHMTHPVFGSITLTYSAGHWTGTKVYSYPGSVGGSSCAADTVTITCDMDDGYNYTESWLYDGSDCPTDSGTNTATAFWTFENVDCYVPSVTAFSANFSKTPFAGPQANLYDTSFLNLSITE